MPENRASAVKSRTRSGPRRGTTRSDSHPRPVSTASIAGAAQVKIDWNSRYMISEEHHAAEGRMQEKGIDAILRAQQHVAPGAVLARQLMRGAAQQDVGGRVVLRCGRRLAQGRGDVLVKRIEPLTGTCRDPQHRCTELLPEGVQVNVSLWACSTSIRFASTTTGRPARRPRG
jgi:hypothetical protein